MYVTCSALTRVPMCGFVPRHHCRACGQVFCDACSSRVAFLPGHDAASGDVALRVCDACFVEGLRFKDAATTRAKLAAVGATTASALAADGEPSRSATTRFLAPESRRFSAWAWPWLP